MKRVTLLLALAVTAITLVACGEREVVEEITIERNIDASAEPGLVHTVYFWLKEDSNTAARKSFQQGVQSLEAIPSVRRMFVGPPASTPSRGVVDNSFDYALIVWFDDVAGHDVYQEHPIHLAFVEAHEDKFAEVKVYDNILGNIQ